MGAAFLEAAGAMIHRGRVSVGDERNKSLRPSYRLSCRDWAIC